jgi:hypothetical protein
MSIDNLSARLKAELGRNKAKSAVLIVMCLVAAYFWLPLVGKWFGGESTEDAEVTVANETGGEGASANVAPPEKQTPVVKSVDWKAAVARLRGEPRMSPIDSFALTRNPFANLSVPVALENEEENEDEAEGKSDSKAEPKPRTFEQLGLLLNGTMVGSRSRMATVNGQNYQEGDEFAVLTAESTIDDQDEPQLEQSTLLMKEIHSRYVIVSYDGQLHTLYLPPLTLSQTGRIVVNRPLLNRVED